MPSITNNCHAASPVPDSAVASNAHAVKLGSRLKMLAQGDGQQGLGMVMQSVRSSSKKWDTPPVSYRRGIFSRLCLSLICIGSLPQSRVSSRTLSSPLPPPSPPPPPPSPRNNQEVRLSSRTASACDDDHAFIASTIMARENSRNERRLSAYPIRMEEPITVDWRRGVGYGLHSAEPQSCFHVYGKEYAFRDSIHLQQLSEFDRLYTDVLPFYRERLSHQWHSCMFHTTPVFTKKERAFIDKIKIINGERFSYEAVDNAVPQRYGSAKIYYAKYLDGCVVLSSSSPLRVVELYGELVPVRTLNNGSYEAYRRDKPAGTTLAIEWDGRRWISARHAVAHLDKRLVKDLTRGSDIRAHNLSARDIFVTDEKGIYRRQNQSRTGYGYIKIGRNFFLLEPVENCPNEYRIEHEQRKLEVVFENAKLRLKKASRVRRWQAYFNPYALISTLLPDKVRNQYG